MIVSFESESIRDLCEDESSAISRFGEQVATVFFSRLSDIEAAKNPSELIAGNPRHIKIDDTICYQVDINESISVIFTAALSNSGNNWKDVHRIKILKIE